MKEKILSEYNTVKLDSVIQKLVKSSDDGRSLQHHTPKKPAQAVSLEETELQEIFRWISADDDK